MARIAVTRSRVRVLSRVSVLTHAVAFLSLLVDGNHPIIVGSSSYRYVRICLQVILLRSARSRCEIRFSYLEFLNHLLINRTYGTADVYVRYENIWNKRDVRVTEIVKWGKIPVAIFNG